ncbi:MAG: ECF transporter S component [bacterium]|nr:ECF transporter S component [bacterium]
MKKEILRKVIATAVTAILFFVLGKLSVATKIDSIYISWQYALQSAVAAMSGPVVAMISGLIGHFLIDVTYAGPEWGWILATVVFGGITGVLMKDIDYRKDSKKTVLIRYNIAHIVAHLLSWIVVAPVLDLLINPSSDMLVLFTQGVTAAAVNIVTTGVAGSLFLLTHIMMIQSKENA